MGFTTRKLYDEGVNPIADGPPEDIRPGADQLIAGHHFGHDKPCPELVRLLAERKIRHARHRRKKNGVRKLQRADAQWVAGALHEAVACNLINNVK
jgi:hypothetical protein